MSGKWLGLALAAGALMLPAGAENWPPATELSFDGRRAELFWHGSRPEWGYPGNQTDFFILLHPEVDRPDAPLYVVLHSAGHNAMTALECVGHPGNHDIYHPPRDFYGLFLDCKLNLWRDWWWGGLHVNDRSLDKNAGPDVQPVERRVVDTVRWVIERYRIDPNRVYLAGNSMGGSGALGIGMRNGDLFAAIKVGVPAGIEHVSHRMGFAPQTLPVEVKIPDPPVVIDFSAQNDNWSFGHERLVAGMRDHKYPLFLYWGTFGHGNNAEAIARKNDLVDSLDWLAIRRDQAYPVFTNASSDDPLPWPEQLDDPNPGQINGFFRWRNLEDTPARFRMELRLLKAGELKTRFKLPGEVTCQVTPRRLQQFRVEPGREYTWRFGEQQGRVRADEHGLLTLPLTITATPTVLELLP